VLAASHVARRLGASPVAAPAGAEPVAAAEPKSARTNLRDELADLERRRIDEALEAHDGHQANAAAALGMPLRTFVAKLKRYRIQTRRRP
jgi:transcriptional regulator with GAF, ATPase, and Fis domain